MTGTGSKWVLDRFTTLYFVRGKYAIRWAGAMSYPVSRLEDICYGQLLEQCRTLISTPGEPVTLVECDGFYESSTTIEM